MLMIRNLHPYWYETYHSLEQQGLSQRKIAKEMQVHRTTLQHWLKEKNKGVVTKEALQEVHKQYQKSGSKEHENQRILLVSDMHLPYGHQDTLPFLAYLKAKYKPTRVICLGDELDKHSLSFHSHDPDLASPSDELARALPMIKQLKKMFTKMDILESNHGSLAYRRAKANGIPRGYLKSYNDVLGVDSDWVWHYEMTITLPNGNKVYLHHGKAADIKKLSTSLGMCAVSGHYHQTFKVDYWANSLGLYWGMNVGCLIDDKSLAFAYNNCNLHRPLIGTGLIIDSQPILVPLLMDENGAWVKPSDYDEVMGGQT